jgi:hypothetical protein
VKNTPFSTPPLSVNRCRIDLEEAFPA